MPGTDDDALFDLPPSAHVPVRKVVLIAGASGSGKSSIAHRLGLPVVRLDDFYLDHDVPGLPHKRGMVDWDSPATWDADSAATALIHACREDRLEVPTYDIPTSRRTGFEAIDIQGASLLLAEGIFAAELLEPLTSAGVLADAVYLDQSRFVTAFRRFARDVGESRKPIPALVKRGVALTRAEPAMVARWRECGLRPLPINDAEAVLRGLVPSS